jgi:hypothetical protein
MMTEQRNLTGCHSGTFRANEKEICYNEQQQVTTADVLLYCFSGADVTSLNRKVRELIKKYPLLISSKNNFHL